MTMPPPLYKIGEGGQQYNSGRAVLQASYSQEESPICEVLPILQSDTCQAPK